VHGSRSIAQIQSAKRPRSARVALAIVGAALVSALGVVSSSAAAAGATAPPSTPAVVISPLRGTPDANPDTQISFLGVPASELGAIVVTGSRSGRHSGRVEAYSTGTGASFLPRKPFLAGERVTVSATVVAGSTSETIGTSFYVAEPYRLPPPTPKKRVPVTASNVLHFHSQPKLQPNAVAVTTPAADPTAGDIFIAPDSGAGLDGPMIVSPTGSLIWFDQLRRGTTAYNFHVQEYAGQPVLTWYEGAVVGGHGQGVDIIENANYVPLATVRAGNGLYADLHDFVIGPQNTAWLTAYAPIHWNLSSVGGPSDGLLDDGTVQEIDIKTGLVMFQWDALGHVALSDTYAVVPHLTPTPFDFFHVNSVDPQADGDVLISSRNTSTAYLISGTTGAVLWRLGGKKSSFKLGPGVRFAYQHDVEMLPNGTITVFDNENGPPPSPTPSRAIDIAINPQAGTATLVYALTYPGTRLVAGTQGDVQLLANGDDFVGWGTAGVVSEFSPTGQLTFAMRFHWPTHTYRAFRAPWSGQPLTRPALVAGKPTHGSTELYASWNGATDVASWQVLAGASLTSLAPVNSYPSTGFETAILAPTIGPYVCVHALSASGAVLSTACRVLRA
jgi:hypothetical protein